MATYFDGNSDIQADGLQTLILMNPSYVNYSDTSQQHQHHNQQQPNNFFFLNSDGPDGASRGYSHALPQSTQQFTGIPIPTISTHTQHEINGYMPRAQYNLWNSVDPSVAARDVTRAQRGLSLSLSSQQPGFGSFRADERELPTHSLLSPATRVSPVSGVTTGVSSGIQSVLLNSKYLKVAQQVLDEVVNVVNSDAAKKSIGKSKVVAGKASSTGEEASEKLVPQLSTAERQEIQTTKGKLVGMLHEVEQRYRQYHHQMQIVISSFEQVVGTGSARTYTSLALQTISKQFRCLKDAILGQLRAANKSLGEEDYLGGGKMDGGGSSRLKFVDHQLRQQRALQQLGMIQHNAWRPQRGLPERSVSVLRAWLFEHFLHPYPKDSDKHILAKQTGLTRSQVSNWFINARVRLWKPMVEEMYLEEIKEQERNGSEDNGTSKSDQNDDSGSRSTALQEKSPVLDHTHSFKAKKENHQIIHNVSQIGSSDLDRIMHGSPKKIRNGEMLNNEQISMDFGMERQNRDGYSLMGPPTNFIGGFGSYPIGEMDRFEPEHYQRRFLSNTVSLTLGLPDNENQSFFPSQNIHLGAMNNPTPPSSTPAYGNVNIQNRKRFAAQLLPDFVT